MAEYIEREALMKKIFPYNVVNEASYAINAKAVKVAIENAPTADVVEVRRGRWLPQRLLGADVVDCSECKTLGSPQWKWCPVCGADMRGKANEKM